MISLSVVLKNSWAFLFVIHFRYYLKKLIFNYSWSFTSILWVYNHKNFINGSTNDQRSILVALCNFGGIFQSSVFTIHDCNMKQVVLLYLRFKQLNKINKINRNKFKLSILDKYCYLYIFLREYFTSLFQFNFSRYLYKSINP